MFKEDNVEEMYTLLGKRCGRLWVAELHGYGKGQPASVRFDPDFAIHNKDRLIGWIHTHPMMPGYPSAIDDRTMAAWCITLGGPLLCAIKGNDGVIWANWYFDEETPAVRGKIQKVGSKLIGIVPKDPRKVKEKVSVQKERA